jgi:putative ABC transport system ATP-binding protein
MPLVRLRSVSKRYGEGTRVVWALRDINLEVQPGEFLSIMGPSGSGKSTVLNMISALDHPTSGDVEVDGQGISALRGRHLARFRRRTVAVIFQFYNLLPTLTARENVSVPLQADALGRRQINERVERALTAVGMMARADHYPDELSGGEMQRVAIARALATDARIIAADEPTGNLDTARGEEILRLLKDVTEGEARAVILVTHDFRAAAYGDRQITLRDGRIVGEVRTPSAEGSVTLLRR